MHRFNRFTWEHLVMKDKHIPYNTGKIKIGLLYEPKPPAVQSADEARLQMALLGMYDNTPMRVTKRYFGMVLFVIALILLVAYAPR